MVTAIGRYVNQQGSANYELKLTPAIIVGKILAEVVSEIANSKKVEKTTVNPTRSFIMFLTGVSDDLTVSSVQQTLERTEVGDAVFSPKDTALKLLRHLVSKNKGVKPFDWDKVIGLTKKDVEKNLGINITILDLLCTDEQSTLDVFECFKDVQKVGAEAWGLSESRASVEYFVDEVHKFQNIHGKVNKTLTKLFKEACNDFENECGQLEALSIENECLKQEAALSLEKLTTLKMELEIELKNKEELVQDVMMAETTREFNLNLEHLLSDNGVIDSKLLVLKNHDFGLILQAYYTGEQSTTNNKGKTKTVDEEIELFIKLFGKHNLSLAKAYYELLLEHNKMIVGIELLVFSQKTNENGSDIRVNCSLTTGELIKYLTSHFPSLLKQLPQLPPKNEGNQPSSISRKFSFGNLFKTFDVLDEEQKVVTKLHSLLCSRSISPYSPDGSLHSIFELQGYDFFKLLLSSEDFLDSGSVYQYQNIPIRQRHTPYGNIECGANGDCVMNSFLSGIVNIAKETCTISGNNIIQFGSSGATLDLTDPRKVVLILQDGTTMDLTQSDSIPKIKKMLLTDNSIRVLSHVLLGDLIPHADSIASIDGLMKFLNESMTKWESSIFLKNLREIGINSMTDELRDYSKSTDEELVSYGLLKLIENPYLIDKISKEILEYYVSHSRAHVSQPMLFCLSQLSLELFNEMPDFRITNFHRPLEGQDNREGRIRLVGDTHGTHVQLASL
jgi:hypothetical protein